jgi:predicted HicB family RNase H-like nuclease
LKEDNMDEEVVTITLELDKELLYNLMLMAHEQDITLNNLVVNILREKISNSVS